MLFTFRISLSFNHFLLQISLAWPDVIVFFSKCSKWSSWVSFETFFSWYLPLHRPCGG